MSFQSVSTAELAPGALVTSSLLTRIYQNTIYSSVISSGSSVVGDGTEVTPPTLTITFPGIVLAANQKLKVKVNGSAESSGGAANGVTSVDITHNAVSIGGVYNISDPNNFGNATCYGESTTAATGDLVVTITTTDAAATLTYKDIATYYEIIGT